MNGRHYPIGLSTEMETFNIWANTVDTRYLWLWSTWNMTSTSEEIKSLFHLILINWNSHRQIIATILHATALKSLGWSFRKQLQHALYKIGAPNVCCSTLNWIEVNINLSRHNLCRFKKKTDWGREKLQEIQGQHGKTWNDNNPPPQKKPHQNQHLLQKRTLTSFCPCSSSIRKRYVKTGKYVTYKPSF